MPISSRFLISLSQHCKQHPFKNTYEISKKGKSIENLYRQRVQNYLLKAGADTGE